MYKFLFALIVAFTHSFVFAQTVNPCQNLAESTRGLNTVATNTLLESCRATTGALPFNITPEAATTWGAASKDFAYSIGIAAKELGMATNDFLKSPAGIIFATILAIKFAGSLIIGIPMTVFILLLWWRVTRYIVTEVKEYEMVQWFWGLFSTRRVKKAAVVYNEFNVGYLIISTIAVLILLITVWVNA